MHNAHDAFLSWHLKVKTAMLLYYDPPTITSFRSFVNTLVLMALDNNLYRLFIVFILSFNCFADFQPLGAGLPTPAHVDPCAPRGTHHPGGGQAPRLDRHRGAGRDG